MIVVSIIPCFAVCVCMLAAQQENVAMMDEYLPLSHFKAVYIVDLCHSLCEQVRSRSRVVGAATVGGGTQPSATTTAQGLTF